MPTRTTKTTTQRGYGHAHQKRRARLLRQHIDGTPCPCRPDCGPSCLCVASGGLPMYRDPASNPDGYPLDADHNIPLSLGGTHADRLMLASCNRSRGDGTRTASDDRRRWTTRDW